MPSPRGLLWSLLPLPLVIGFESPAAKAYENASAPVPAVVQRFLDREDEPLIRYRALRRLDAQNGRYKKEGWVEAWTTLDPEQGFRYEIVGEGGSGYVRDKVLRKALEGEAGAYARAESKSAAIVPANYTFVDQGAIPDGLVGVAIAPLRKDAMLVRGRILLTPDDADLVRIEGQLVKTPSFWTRRVDIVRRYERIDGVRVPVAIESVAQILIAGRSTFRMVYEYASVNGRTVGDPRPRPAEASASRGTR